MSVSFNKSGKVVGTRVSAKVVLHRKRDVIEQIRARQAPSQRNV